ncbi:hypothetical protein MMC08_001883 [Hypocenomyce scalaris]|nr:hypothetical protein [Hypocenomyce scalaris]
MRHPPKPSYSKRSLSRSTWARWDTEEVVDILAALCGSEASSLRDCLLLAREPFRKTAGIINGVVSVPAVRRAHVTKIKCPQKVEAEAPLRPFRWLDKHDDVLRVAFQPGNIERVQAWLEWRHLLVCSKEWLQYRLMELELREQKGSRHL